MFDMWQWTTRREGFGETLTLTAVINIVMVFSVAVGYKQIMHYASFRNNWEYIVFIVSLLMGNLSSIGCNIVQANQKLVLLGVCDLCLQLTRMLIAILCGLSGSGPIAIIYGNIVSSIVVGTMTYHFLKQQMHRIDMKYFFSIKRETLEYYFWALVLSFLTAVYLNGGDILLGNLFSDKESIGYYSVATNISKIAIYTLVAPLGTVLFTKIAAKQKKKIIRLKCWLLH